MWAIMSKVRFEAFLWGAGTALGELPPYFMAKASRLSGAEHEDFDDIKELEDRKKHGDKLNLFERGKLAMEKFVEKVGFLGILLCASVSINAKSYKQHNLTVPFTDSKPTVRSRWDHLWSLPGAILDVFRGDIDREGHCQDAHTENIRHHRFQRNSRGKSR